AEPQDPGKLDQTAYTQPALFALEYALAALWQSWGITPDAVMGHSAGEYVAACVAGVFGLEEGLMLMAKRGQFMQALPQDGAMVAIFAAEDQVRTAMSSYAQDVAIAAVNGHRNTVISGRREAVHRMVAELEMQGIASKALPVSHAFHSPLMEPMLTAFAQVARIVDYAPPQTELISNVTGELIAEDIATPDYWCQHIREPVRFAAGMATLHQQGYDLFVEVGPQPILLDMGRQCLPEDVGVWLPSLRRTQEWEVLLQSVGALYERGGSVDWAGFDRDYMRRKVVVPTYPFQRQRYWVATDSDPRALPPHRDRATYLHPLLGQRLYLAGSQEFRFESQLSPDSPAYLTHHRVFDNALVPATAYLEMALAAGTAMFKPVLDPCAAPEQLPEHLMIEDFVIQQALVLPDDDVQTMQCTLAPVDDRLSSFQVHSAQPLAETENGEPSWRLHASGHVRIIRDAQPPLADLETLRDFFHKELHVQDHYRQCRDSGIAYGPGFQAIERLWRRNGEALGQICVPAALLPDVADYTLHPVLLDAGLQVLLAALPTADAEAYVPVSVERLRLYRRPGHTLWSHAVLHTANHAPQQTVTAHIHLWDVAGAVVAEIEGFTLKRTSREALIPLPEMSWQDCLYEVEWRAEANTPLAEIEPGHWLVLTDNAGLGRQLAARLRSGGSPCTLVFPGKTYEQLAEAAFRIDPGNPDDYRRLLQAVPGVQGVVHLWSLDTDLDDFEATLRQGCGSTLHLVHALVNQTRPASLWLVTRGAVGCPGHQVPGVAQSPLWGLGKVIALEHPELHCRQIDLDPNAVDAEVEVLGAEIVSKTPEDHIAFRHQVRLAPRLVPFRPQRAPATPSLREDDAYLIVGGTRGLGLLVARWMVSKGARHLVLMSRSGAADTATIAALEHAGAQVVVTQADVSEAEEVSQVLAHIDRPLRGIIHAAGVLDDGILQQQTLERFARVMAPKVRGAWHLHTLTKDMSLDFFVLFSSTASLLGSGGQANYAAANAFLDVLAHYRRAHGLPGVAINWGGWSEVGMAARSEVRERMNMTGL
ncbi:MAG: SDR family NAD(P)-dependent oxidoreductase, partial [Candidatus Tectomicrobia bacterium]|nr:SDR family NAD(P)-dependent oxidoreductase [Candidatus Tectomicrobia bacterium]